MCAISAHCFYIFFEQAIVKHVCIIGLCYFIIDPLHADTLYMSCNKSKPLEISHYHMLLVKMLAFKTFFIN